MFCNNTSMSLFSPKFMVCKILCVTLISSQRPSGRPVSCFLAGDGEGRENELLTRMLPAVQIALIHEGT